MRVSETRAHCVSFTSITHIYKSKNTRKTPVLWCFQRVQNGSINQKWVAEVSWNTQIMVQRFSGIFFKCLSNFFLNNIGLEAGCKSSKKITSHMFSPSHDRFWWCRFCSFGLRLSEVFFDPVENYKMLMSYVELDNHWYSGEELWQT